MSQKLRKCLDVYNRLIHDKKLGIHLCDVMIIYNNNIDGEQEICINDYEDKKIKATHPHSSRGRGCQGKGFI